MPADFSAYSFGFALARAMQPRTKRAIDGNSIFSAPPPYSPAKQTASSPGTNFFRQLPAKPARPVMTSMPTPAADSKKIAPPPSAGRYGILDDRPPARSQNPVSLPPTGSAANRAAAVNMPIPQVPPAQIEIDAPELSTAPASPMLSDAEAGIDMSPKSPAQRYGFHSSVNNQGFGTATPRPAASKTIAPTDNANYQQLTSSYGSQARPTPRPATSPAGLSAAALARAGRPVR